MPWIKAQLRGQVVYARVRDDGQFDASSGRVEIRYNARGGKPYHAAVVNLQIVDKALLPDDTCADLPASLPPGGGGSPVSAGTATEAHKPQKRGPQWIAYTDGACSGNPGPAGAGVVLIGPDGKTSEGSYYLGTGTNNIGELAAILHGIKAVPEGSDVVVHTDSKYSIGVLSKGWKAKANAELIAETRQALGRHAQIRFVYVPGHAGIPLNERADELARQAIREGRSRPIQL